LPESYLAPQQTRDLRELVRTRMFFVRMRTSAKIRLRSVLSKNGLIAPVSEITSKKAQEWFSKIELSAVYRQEYTRLLEHITQLDEHISRYDAEIKKQGKGYPEVAILKSIPGIADIRSMMIIAEVGTFTRFAHPDKLAAFAGLVPRSYSSGGKERLGRITKHGSSVLRHALVGAAQQANSSWGDLFTFYERIRTKHSSGAAKVALARKLLALAWHLTRKNELFKARFAAEPMGSVNV
jgi:transposase